MLADFTDIIGIDARFLVFLVFALDNAVCITLGLERFAGFGGSGCAQLVPNWSCDDAVDCLNDTSWLCAA
jgi:hypothetical protein